MVTVCHPATMSAFKQLFFSTRVLFFFLLHVLFFSVVIPLLRFPLTDTCIIYGMGARLLFLESHSKPRHYFSFIASSTMDLFIVLHPLSPLCPLL